MSVRGLCSRCWKKTAGLVAMARAGEETRQSPQTRRELNSLSIISSAPEQTDKRLESFRNYTLLNLLQCLRFLVDACTLCKLYVLYIKKILTKIKEDDFETVVNRIATRHKIPDPIRDSVLDGNGTMSRIRKRRS